MEGSPVFETRTVSTTGGALPLPEKGYFYVGFQISVTMDDSAAGVRLYDSKKSFDADVGAASVTGRWIPIAHKQAVGMEGRLSNGTEGIGGTLWARATSGVATLSIAYFVRGGP